MTKAELEKNWQQVLDILRENIGFLKVNSYFGPLTPVKLREKDQTITVLTTTTNAQYNQSLINRNVEELSAAVEAVFGKVYKVVITDKIEQEEDDEVSRENYQFNLNYSFENFVAGENSRMAYMAAYGVAEAFDSMSNPLFIYGDSGLGKTHLLHSIGIFVRRNRPKKKVLYVSSETFTNEFVYALRREKKDSSMDDFRAKYRNVDYLLFDDVQFLANRTETLTELFNTYEALYHAGKQIVFTSDRPPKDLKEIPDRLVSRFSSGLSVDIKPPEYETRLAILQNKAVLEGLDIKDPDLMGALDLIAQNVQNNIRELEGAFTRVLTFSNLLNQRITEKFAKEVLSDIYIQKSKEITPEDIKKAVAKYFSIKVSDLESPARSRSIAYPRHIAIYLIHTKLDYSLPVTGKYFGGRDHTTVMNSIKRIKADLMKNSDLKETLEKIEKTLE